MGVSIVARFTFVFMLSVAGMAHARPTPEQKCQAGKNIAAGRLAACLQNVEGKLAATGDQGKYAQAKLDCSYQFATKWLQLERSAARADVTCPDAPLEQSALEAAITQCSMSVASALAGGGLPDCTASLSTCLDDLGASQAAHSACVASLDAAESNLAECQAALAACNLPTPIPTPTPSPTTSPTPTSTPIPRFIDNGDGTVTDNQTGLQWEQKTGTPVGPRTDCSMVECSDPHDVRNNYAWCLDANHNFACDNAGSPPNGGAFTDFLIKLNAGDGFAGHTDWRLPTLEELQTIQLAPPPFLCATAPCIDPIFGPTKEGAYWSSTTNATIPSEAWNVNFGFGYLGSNTKPTDLAVRAVRTGP